ncbi:MAG: cytochrome c3 family protein, partial [Bacillota bacterium]
MHARPKVFILVLFLFAVFLMGSSISSVSVSALAYQSPHGPYDSFPVGCAACHVAHAGGGPNLLNGAVNTTTLCLACHDGTASVFNVVYVPKEDPVTGITQAVYGLGFYDTNATHFHPVRNTQNPAVGQVLECTNCHNPHGDSSGGGGVYARLLNSYDGTSRYYQGPDYCLGCHGAADRGFASVEN